MTSRSCIAVPERVSNPVRPDLSVTCLRHPRWSDVFDYICKHAAKHKEQLEVFVERHGNASEVRMRTVAPVGPMVTTRHRDVFLAVDNAFRNLALHHTRIARRHSA